MRPFAFLVTTADEPWRALTESHLESELPRGGRRFDRHLLSRLLAVSNQPG